jgi:hypothetical protein
MFSTTLCWCFHPSYLGKIRAINFPSGLVKPTPFVKITQSTPISESPESAPDIAPNNHFFSGRIEIVEGAEGGK